MFLLLLLIICLSALSVSVMGDTLTHDFEKHQESCFKIENQEDYPNYVFISHQHTRAMTHSDVDIWKMIEPGECIIMTPGYYSSTTATIYALKKVNEEKFKQIAEIEPKTPVEDYLKIRQEVIIKSLNQSLISSGIELNYQGNGWVSILNPVESIQEVLTVKTLNDQKFVLEREKFSYIYNWKVDLVLGGIFISLVALITIIVVLIKRFRK